jgi:hypothetical protein
MNAIREKGWRLRIEVFKQLSPIAPRGPVQ